MPRGCSRPFFTAWWQAFKSRHPKRQEVEAGSFMVPGPETGTAPLPRMLLVKHSKGPEPGGDDKDPSPHHTMRKVQRSWEMFQTTIPYYDFFKLIQLKDGLIFTITL